MTEVTKPEEQKLKEKEERRGKERDAVRKQAEDASKAHDELGKKFLKEDAEEAEKKVKEAK